MIQGARSPRGLVLRYLIGAAGLVVCTIGLWFFLDGPGAMAALAHSEGNLVAVMGGRYIALGLVLMVLTAMADLSVLGWVLLTYALLGFIDAAIYWRADPVPHIAAGLLSLAASVAAFFLSKGRF